MKSWVSWCSFVFLLTTNETPTREHRGVVSKFFLAFCNPSFHIFSHHLCFVGGSLVSTLTSWSGFGQALTLLCLGLTNPNPPEQRFWVGWPKQKLENFLLSRTREAQVEGTRDVLHWCPYPSTLELSVHMCTWMRSREGLPNQIGFIPTLQKRRGYKCPHPHLWLGKIVKASQQS